MVFVNAFAPTPLCTPARASILTGTSTRTHDVDSLTDSGMHPDWTMAAWSGRVRASFFGKYPKFAVGPQPYWDGWFAIEGSPDYGGRHGQTWVQNGVTYPGCCASLKPPLPKGCQPGHPACEGDETYQTTVLMDQVRQELRTPGAHLVVLAPTAPHVGSVYVPVPAARHFGRFAGLPPARPPSWGIPGAWGGTSTPDDVIRQLNDAGWRLYLETLLSVDEEVGALLDDLDSSGRLEETLLIFTSDNGVAFGEHGLWVEAKSCPYDECQRVPLWIRVPGRGGAVTNATALLEDIAPTVADYLQLAATPTDGRSLRQILEGCVPPDWRQDYCLELKDTLALHYQGVRDVAANLVYVEYANGAKELFDLTRDPHQVHSVLDRPEYVSHRLRLAARVRTLCRW
jgi:arylsulfatase A-like enzyme